MVGTANNHILHFFKSINRLRRVKLSKSTQVRVLLLGIIKNNIYGFRFVIIYYHFSLKWEI